MNQDEFDEEHLRKAAEQALGFDGPTGLDGPGNGHTNMPDGFGVVYSYPPQAGDLVNESNYYATLAALKKAAGDNAERDIKEASIRHWTYSYFDVLMVRVYEPGYAPEAVEYDFNHVQYTAAFLEAVRCADARREYPLLDESDFSQREWDGWDKEVREAAWAAGRDFDFDTTDEHERIVTVMYELAETEPDGTYGDKSMAFGGADGFTADNVDYDAVKECYLKARNEFFERRALAMQ